MNRLLTRSVSLLLTAGLLAVCIPAGPVVAKPVTKLTVDVWTDKGGEGVDASGGQYRLGERPLIYFKVSIGCHTRLTISGPDGTHSSEQPAMYGPVYQLQLGDAEEDDIGQWYVVLEAVTSARDQYAIDRTSFVIVAPAPGPSPPPSPTTPSQPSWSLVIPSESPETPAPPATPPEASSSSSSTSAGVTTMESVVVSPLLALEVDGLRAMKMARGSLPVDLYLDATGDGEVTEEDARLILRWAVARQSFLGPGFDPDRLQIMGQEADGTASWIYRFPRQEVARDVFLDKTLEFSGAPEGHQKRITLTFQNESDAEVEIRHVEVIPKTFAAHVDDLRFSHPPEEIIDPDPSVGFLVTLGALAWVGIDIVLTPAKFAETWTERAGWAGGLVSRPYMTPSRFTALDADAQCAFIREALEPHLGIIRMSARRNNIPASLLAMVILNELIDYGPVDQAQEHIPNRGSSGMAQIQVRTAIEHNLVDVSDQEIDESMVFRYYRTSIATLDAQSLNRLRQGTREYLVWQKLNEPAHAIEAAAREISIQLDRMNQNLDKTWGTHFLSRPVDRTDIYASIKARNPGEKDPEKVTLMKKEALAFMVTAIYNSPKLAEFAKPITKDFYQGDFGENDPYPNAINHGQWAAIFVKTLERCLPLDEPKSLDLTQYTRVSISVGVHANWVYSGDDDSFRRYLNIGGVRGWVSSTVSVSCVGQWISETQFAGTWERTEETMQGDLKRYRGEVNVVFAPDDPAHLVTFRAVETMDRPEKTVRRITTVIEGRDLYHDPTMGARYHIYGAEACQHITSLMGTRRDYDDGSWSELKEFNCDRPGTGIIIQFMRPDGSG